MNTYSNCGATFTSPYCPECGQKAGTGRLTMHTLLHEVWHGFTHTDKGIMRLWKELLLHPRTAYQNYFSGKRKSYFSPVVFFLLSFGLLVYIDQQVFDYRDYVNVKLTGHPLNNEIGEYLFEHTKYMALALLPLQALASWLFFGKRYNLAECTTFWLFCIAFTNTIVIILTPIRFLFITHQQNLGYFFNMLTAAIYLWHGLLIFGKGLWNKIKMLALVVLISISSVYNTFYFLSLKVNTVYPTLWQSIKIAFGNKSVSYYGGKFTIEE